MATNENVNKVIYGNQTVMDITDTTAEESDVASGEVFYKANGARSVGTLNAATLNQLRQTIGYVGVNDMPFPYDFTEITQDGITFKVESDGTITLSGRATSLTTVTLTQNYVGDNKYHYFGIITTEKSTWDYITAAENIQMIVKSTLVNRDSISRMAFGTGELVIIKIRVNSGVDLTSKTLNLMPVILRQNSFDKRIDEVESNCYKTGATIASSLDDYDKFPCYLGNTSSLDPRRNVRFSTIKSALKTFFDTIYSTFSGSYNDLTDKPTVDQTYSATSSNAQSGTAVAEVVEQIYADNGVLGAKNLLPNNATSQTKNGITFTVNNDGSVTVNGTATANAELVVSYDIPYLYGGKYILSGCPFGGADNKYRITAYRVDSTDGQSGSLFDIGDGLEFTYKNQTGNARFIIYIENGVTVSNLTFYPMLRLASDPDDTYVPYAMTNREITETVNNISPALITSPMPSYVANSLPVRKKDITNDFYNGTLRAEIAAGNFANVRPGDYIIGQSSGSTYYVACLDYRLGKGDQTNNANYPAYGTHHLGLMLFKHNGATRLWAGYGNQDKSWRVSANDKGRCPWNAAADVDPTNSEAIGTNSTNITRQYNGVNVSGYMGSFIRERIDEIILTEDFIADFGSANVLKYREINGNAITTDKPSGGQGNWNGCTSGWGWYDRFLDLPSEIELYGSRVFGSAYDTGCQCEQLPFLKNAAIHDFFPRIDIWTKAVASSSYAAYRTGDGVAGSSGASGARWACPLACVR